MSVEAICGTALCCCAAGMILKSVNKEYAFIAGAAGGIILIFAAVSLISPVIDFIRVSSADTPFSSYYTVLLKAMGIAFLTHTAAEICRDCGESSIGNKIETVGKLSIIILSLPVIQKLLDMAKELAA